MPTTAARRQLLVAGLLLFLSGLIIGLVVPALRNPRAGLSAHLEGVMNGMFLMIAGLAWEHLRLGQRTSAVARGLLVGGTYLNFAATIGGAALGTSKATPIAGAGFTGTPAAENAVYAALAVVAIAMVLGLALMIRGGLRRPDDR